MDQARGLLTVLLVATVALAGCTQLINDATGQPSNTWALEMTGASTLHERGLTGQGVKVAIVDTGVQTSHQEFEDMPGRIQWGDVVNNRDEPYDDAGHGTHVTGIVFAQGNGGLQAPLTEGVAPGADMIHIKAIPGGPNSQGSDGDVADAIDMAVQQGAHVLVLSLGSEPSLIPLGQETENAVSRAIEEGVVVVAAAGNANPEEGEDSGEDCTVKSPASMRRVIAVGAVDRAATLASFSCSGDNSGGPLGLMQPEDPNKKPELVAPGVQIIGPWPSRDCAGQVSRYCVLSGTSQAAPYVGGIVALLLEEHPELQRKGPDQVHRIKRILTETAQERAGQSGHDDRYGYGLVRADRALEAMG